MNKDQIMKLVDAYVEAVSEGEGSAQARAAVVEAIEALTKDADRLNFIEAHAATKTLEWNRKSKWSYHQTFTSYEYQTFKTAREAIDAAVRESK